jgi:hypothetical protein
LFTGRIGGASVALSKTVSRPIVKKSSAADSASVATVAADTTSSGQTTLEEESDAFTPELHLDKEEDRTQNVDGTSLEAFFAEEEGP